MLESAWSGVYFCAYPQNSCDKDTIYQIRGLNRPYFRGRKVHHNITVKPVKYIPVMYFTPEPNVDPVTKRSAQNMVVPVEMESFALLPMQMCFIKATCMLTISEFHAKERTTAQRGTWTSFTDVVTVALGGLSGLKILTYKIL